MPAYPETALHAIEQALDCPAELAELVARQARYSRHCPRATILPGGASEPGIHLMVSGHARMVAISVDGRLVLVCDYLSGEIFGEGALTGDTDAHEVIAVDLVETGAFPPATFLSLMTNHPCIALAVSRAVIARLRATTQRLVEGNTLSAPGRIHAELLRLARAGKDMTIRPAPVLSVLALGVQSTRETTSRTIAALERRGIIRRDSESLTIIAPHRLEELIY
jgi:CRP-like cAMP-binding protein